MAKLISPVHLSSLMMNHSSEDFDYLISLLITMMLRYVTLLLVLHFNRIHSFIHCPDARVNWDYIGVMWSWVEYWRCMVAATCNN